MVWKQKGSALINVLFIVIILSVMIFGLSTLQRATSVYVNQDKNQVIAEYASQAGVKIGLQIAYTQIRTNDKTKIITTDAVTRNISSDNPNVSYTYKLIPSPDKNQIEVLSKGIVSENGRTYTYYSVIMVDVTTVSTAEVLISPWLDGAKYSHPNGDLSKPAAVWTQDPGPPLKITPPNNEDYFQVKFNKPQDSHLNVSFSASCSSYDPNSNNTGYGIYYGMSSTSTADNPDGYVFQYDPGANEHGTEGSFFVKRVVMHTTSPSSADKNEYNPRTKAYYGDTTPKTSCWVPFEDSQPWDQSKLDQSGYNITKVTLTKLEDIMEKTYMKDVRDYSFDPKAQHIINIEILPPVAPNTLPRHIIRVDGYEILSFVDNTKAKKAPAIKDFKNTYCGLRVWNSESYFYDLLAIQTYNPTGYLWVKYDAAKHGNLD